MPLEDEGHPIDFTKLAHATKPEALIEAARTGKWGRGKKLSDRQIIGILTSNCHTEDQLYDCARIYAPIMGWSIEAFVEQAKRVGKYG